MDGNGRVGRLLITLFLMEKKRLNTPALYISYYLKNNRIEYYDRMSEVRNKNNYEQWIKFFLRAIKESSDDAVETINKLFELHDKNIAIIEQMGRASKTAKEYDAIVVLKDSSTVIAEPNGDIYFNSTGNPGLSNGGSGDCLAGMIASFAAQGYIETACAVCGVYLHGLAADQAAK